MAAFWQRLDQRARLDLQGESQLVERVEVQALLQVGNCSPMNRGQIGDLLLRETTVGPVPVSARLSIPLIVSGIDKKGPISPLPPCPKRPAPLPPVSDP
jgi:hypothetical protein